MENIIFRGTLLIPISIILFSIWVFLFIVFDCILHEGQDYLKMNKKFIIKHKKFFLGLIIGIILCL